MSGINERQLKIVSKINETGYVKVGELCKDLGVSSVTIRKDLNYLERNGLLFRTHGGASKQSLYAFDRPVNEKENLNVDQKKRIARKALNYIHDNEYIILASGTTIHYLSRLIEGVMNLTVLTSSLFVSIELCNNESIDVVQLGGIVRKSSNSVIGSISESMVSEFSCNKLFLGVDGIDLEFGLTTANLIEADLNKKMIKSAEKVIVLADSTKIGKRSFGKIGNLTIVDVLITDSNIPSKYITLFENSGIEVIVA
jgi:DeoR/GlpR family transcriptional regulator of sugar metabolism